MARLLEIIAAGPGDRPKHQRRDVQLMTANRFGSDTGLDAAGGDRRKQDRQLENAAHDVAIVYGPRSTLVIAFLADSVTDIDALYEAMAEAARAAYDLANDPSFWSEPESALATEPGQQLRVRRPSHRSAHPINQPAQTTLPRPAAPTIVLPTPADKPRAAPADTTPARRRSADDRAARPGGGTSAATSAAGHTWPRWRAGLEAGPQTSREAVERSANCRPTSRAGGHSGHQAAGAVDLRSRLRRRRRSAGPAPNPHLASPESPSLARQGGGVDLSMNPHQPDQPRLRNRRRASPGFRPTLPRPRPRSSCSRSTTRIGVGSAPGDSLRGTARLAYAVPWPRPSAAWRLIHGQLDVATAAPILLRLSRDPEVAVEAADAIEQVETGTGLSVSEA